MQTIQLTPYLNFDGNCEEAMNFYAHVFQTQFVAEPARMKDAPGMGEAIAPEYRDRIMNVGFPIGNQLLMASDILPSMGEKFISGNNNYIHITAPSREEATRWFEALSEGGQVEMPMADQFWGDYYGSFTDRFDVCWMISHNPDRP